MPILRQIKIGGGNCRVYRVGLVYGARLCPGTGSRPISLAFRGALLAHGISAARTAVVHDRDRASEHSRHWCDFTRGDFALSQATLLGSVTNPRAPPPRIEKGPTVRAGHAATRPRQKKGRLFHTRRRQRCVECSILGISITSPYRDVGPPYFQTWMVVSGEERGSLSAAVPGACARLRRLVRNRAAQAPYPRRP